MVLERPRPDTSVAARLEGGQGRPCLCGPGHPSDAGSGLRPLSPKLNPQGGAIALGHPFGMTGARILCTLLNDLRSRDRSYGLETMCVGGGQGMAMIAERVS
ncbi:MAG: hypothetical protein JF888_11320 [Candidatus Dormibacteraeota bacterium]|uniref:Thiolase C-terminal domain-containing protein n=1 Tax=Candidatus Dormiibacter inghamiae TaxID=3127013 RepID=A0A934KKK8_9BACT|nr:hypothetical protein [Candidatus Dormibacteraeota bacterium]MBJ7607212.1 hypothetical protein [Candidatus Dormibacteraeota bacterium]